MIITKIEDYTLSELLELFRDKTAQTYDEYKLAIKGPDETLKDTSYKRWSHADDCLANLIRLIEMVRSDSSL